MAATDLSRYHERARTKGVSKPLFWAARALLGVAVQFYFSLERTGRRNIPKKGPVILAANHRSFLDPFVVGFCMRRPVYFVAKKELFEKRWQGWLLNRLGAFPIRRGESDEYSMATARGVLERGGALVMFPEGTRIREGSLGRPKRGVGRLALETGAPVVPIAILGSDRARRGWKILPVWVRIRCGRPLTFPRVENPSPRLAEEVTARVWPCVELQWNWLGGDQLEPVEYVEERKAA
jgi:glycerol-3-phosphate dehydrogenase (NAD(P)+)